jgi:hypothetical protein
MDGAGKPKTKNIISILAAMPRLIACRMRRRQSAPPSSDRFSGKIAYPPLRH